ncbi:DUF916 and DUF3324 domain-containing protein [Schleiferilactobacillus harbinensis]|uniref:DUF916 and DUF3324 domain-containing protein n=1 Tax=Schleiferilactobacillus harbinensis TaxID=304207 RepID=UPI0024324AA2|nr:DUF916 and DUF3324 domain-containing protein [Schleiferilactobacillus harbinensis]MCI1851956.1 DUF916 and DUF3324 domain-containing protein [Schleiferilactobacillus harbinensis]
MDILKRRVAAWLMVIGGVLFFLAGAFPKQVQAATLNFGSANFTVTPIPPKQQSDVNNGGFDVLLSPGESAQLGFKLQNKINKEITVRMRPAAATSSGSGDIGYINFSGPLDDTLANLGVALTKIGAKPQVIKLPPKGVVTVQQKITVPNKPFNGVIVGGYNFISSSYQGKVSSSKGIQLKNQPAYEVGVILLVGKTESVKPDFKLRTIKPAMQSARAVVLFNLQNTMPMYILNKGLTITAKMTPAGSKKVINSLRQKMSFAPNSNADVPLVFENQQLPSGKFTLDVVASTDSQHWHFRKNFTISNAEANRLNRNNLTLKSSYLWLWILIGVLVLIFIVVLVVWLYRRGIKRGQNMRSAGNADKHRRRGR